MEEKKQNNKDVSKKQSRKFLDALTYFLRLVLFSLWTIVYSLGILAVFLAFITYVSYAKNFETAKVKNKSTQNIFYDKEGKVIYESYGTVAPNKIPLSEMPDNIKKATVAAEDADFYYHTAIDIRGIIRAALTSLKYSDSPGVAKVGDLFNEDNYSQGGSTITQQLVKNIYLTDERSFDRKIKEIVFSFELEKKMSKDKILEEYLNNVYYGEQALGIENAAKMYFGKPAKDLNLAEASMLAGLTAAPTQYSPITGDYEAAKKRQEYVLSKMYHEKMITMEQAKEAANEPLALKEVGFQGINTFPFFSQYVFEEVEGKIGKTALDEGGVKVYTSLDSTKQEEAEKIAKDYITNKFASRKVTNASVVVLDNKEGKISAMVGGVDWDKSKVNVAVSNRQPGSSFKPIVYTAGLLNGYSAASRLADQSVNFGGNPPYRPKNYDGSFHGNVTVRTALANSLNIPAVEMAKLAGVEKVIETAKTMGIDSISGNAQQYGLSIGLGSGELKLFELTRAYSVFANGGELGNFSAIEKIVDSEDAEIYTQPRSRSKVLDEKVASIMTNILSDNDARKMIFGPNSPLYLKERKVAAKTGTTDDYSDSWTMGFTPQYTVGVWMGNNDHSKMAKVSGVEGAAYIWHDIMVAIHKDLVAEEFKMAEGISTVWIDPKTGLPAKTQSKPNLLEYFVPGTEPKPDEKFNYLAQFKK